MSESFSSRDHDGDEVPLCKKHLKHYFLRVRSGCTPFTPNNHTTSAQKLEIHSSWDPETSLKLRLHIYKCIFSARPVAILILVTRCSCFLSKFEVLGSLQAQLLFGLTFLAFQTEYNLTGGFGLLVENWLCLSSETHLFGIVTSLSLRKIGCLSCLVLGHLVHSMLLALSGAVSLAFFGNIDHCEIFLVCRHRNTR